jgi:RHS repeat-associated protein
MGSLVDGMRDVTGQIYMRNRYYDPATGQFTQPDPIGIAGGLNTYGFAAGDPVSYADPYGLKACPEDMTAEECEEEERRQQEESRQQEERAQRIQQCYENNRFSSVVGSFTGSETAQDITRVVEIGSATSLGTDAIAMIRKGRGALGTTNRYASGFNMISRSVLRSWASGPNSSRNPSG